MFRRKKRGESLASQGPPVLPASIAESRQSFSLQNLQKVYGPSTRNSSATLPSKLGATPERGTLDAFLANLEKPYANYNGKQGNSHANGEVVQGDPHSSRQNEVVGRAALQGQNSSHVSAGPHKILAPQYQARLGRSRVLARTYEDGQQSKPPQSPAVDTSSFPPADGPTPLPWMSATAPLERQASVSPANIDFSYPLPPNRSDFRQSVSAWAKPATSSHDADTTTQQNQLAQTRRQMPMRRGKAPLALRVMVLGSSGVGKTMWIKTFAESLQPHDDSDMRDGGRWATEQQDQVEAFGMRAGQNTLHPTSKLASLDGLEVVPSKAMHWNVVSRGGSNQRARSPNFGSVDQSSSLRRSRSRKGRSRASSVFLAHGASAPRTKISLSMIDTPALPRSSVSIASSYSTRAPVHLRPIIDQITSRYMKTLQEESKLNRRPTRSSSVEGQHVHCVLWFIDPREVLDGEWWYKMKEDEESERRWKVRAEAGRPRAGSLAAMVKGSADTSARASVHGRRATSGTSPQLDASARLSPSKIKAKQSRQTISGDVRSHRRDTSEIKTRRDTMASPPGRSESPGEDDDLEILQSKDTQNDGAELSGTSSSSSAASASPVMPKPPLATTELQAADDDADDSDSSTLIYSPTLSPTQRLTLRHLLPIVPIIPVIGRADTLTEKELQAVRRGVRSGWKEVITQSKRELKKTDKGDKGERSHRQHHDDGPDNRGDCASSDSSSDYILDGDLSEGEENGEMARWEWDWLKDRHAKKDSLDDDRSTHDNGNVNGNGAGSDAFREDHQGFMADDPSADSYEEEERREKLRLAQKRNDDDDDVASESEPRLLLGVEDIVPSSAELRNRWPLAIFSPEIDTLPSMRRGASSSSPLFSRIYRKPLGAMQTLHPDHCDFPLLRCILLGTHTRRILGSSKGRYEIWRRDVVSRVRGGGASGSGSGNGGGQEL